MSGLVDRLKKWDKGVLKEIFTTANSGAGLWVASMGALWGYGASVVYNSISTEVGIAAGFAAASAALYACVRLGLRKIDIPQGPSIG